MPTRIMQAFSSLVRYTRASNFAILTFQTLKPSNIDQRETGWTLASLLSRPFGGAFYYLALFCCCWNSPDTLKRSGDIRPVLRVCLWLECVNISLSQLKHHGERKQFGRVATRPYIFPENGSRYDFHSRGTNVLPAEPSVGNPIYAYFSETCTLVFWAIRGLLFRNTYLPFQ